MAVAANAQWWVGGTASFMTEKQEQVNPVQSYSFMPEVGYSFNDQWAVGVALGYEYTENGSEDGTDYEGYKINPFARYTFVSGRVGSLFVDGGVGYTYQNGHGYKAHEIEAGFRPGFTFNVTNNFAVVGKFGWLGYTYNGEEKGPKTHEYGLDLDMNEVQLGVCYKF